MIIPRKKSEREDLYIQLVADCMSSQQDRLTRYNILRNWYLFGTDLNAEPVEYNKLFSHIDLYSSYLFSGETTNFVIEIPDTDAHDINIETKKSLKLAPRINDRWHDSNTDIIFNEALNWALVFDTAFVKLVPTRGEELASYIVLPDRVGVLREDVPHLSQQEAICHQFFMARSEVERRISGLPEDKKAEVLALLKPAREAKEERALPSGVKTLIVNATAPDVKGQVNTQNLISYDFNPRNMEDGIDAYELFVYDDEKKDYRTVLVLDGAYVLYDAGKNAFIPNELPWIKITPNWLANNFWGRSELMYLIPLQRWINERIPQIKKHLAKIVDPPISAFGVAETKLSALMNAAGIAAFPETPNTMGSIKEHKVDSVADLFRELKMIEDMFNEISGIREIMKGGGESGVRAGAHADLLARLGSSRAKKKAFILEDAIEHCALLILKYIKKYDDTHYSIEMESGKKSLKFIANQLTHLATVKVDAHSSSPIFLEQQMDKAQLLFQAGAIDEEDLIDAVRYHNASYIKKKLKDRKQSAALAAQAEATKGGQG